MRLGQTSIIHFVSRLLASALGFVATIAIARILGSDSLGIYYLIISMVSWLGIAVTMGVRGAVTKRISDSEDEAAYAIAGGTVSTGLFLVMSAVVLIFQQQVNDYIGYSAAEVVILFLFVNLAQSIVNAVLNGQHLVHISGALTPVRIGTRSIVQITALLAGVGITGLFIGYAVGYLLVAVVGLWIIIRNLTEISFPRRKHYRDLFSYAKYSWLGSLRSRAFNWVDIAVLGFFVSSSIIGVYTAAWNIAVFLMLFGGSLSQTLFPEMSSISAEDDPQSVAGLFETALAYAGLILIPGLVGGILLGEHLLRVYGDEFTQGAAVLSVLIVATLIQGYQRQFTTTLNAIDRPDIAFRINAIFIVANVILNVGLIPSYGIIGAAVATASSVAISLGVAYTYLSSLIDFSIPTGDIARQWTAAGVMGAAVYLSLWLESAYLNVSNNTALVLTLVTVGAAVYFLVLFGISPRFRTTVTDNLPSSRLLADR
ncbi:polysaccharide biosynthesis C-terminal domain-containing protein [Halobellus rarus]|uniref:Polysaccharide biosynthesis C-terminal domain-containing protein n=1 Tax=Halobellus rarus TaxID=1126237 RepID=A0ABD6CMY8_9EURY|nr:polysaccharide biosynthesis C-terminal domain-containing protein [Halobellus rarus]